MDGGGGASASTSTSPQQGKNNYGQFGTSKVAILAVIVLAFLDGYTDRGVEHDGRTKSLPTNLQPRAESVEFLAADSERRAATWWQRTTSPQQLKKLVDDRLDDRVGCLVDRSGRLVD